MFVNEIYADNILNNENLTEFLTKYCQYLAGKYNETSEGYYRIKYNDL